MRLNRLFLLFFVLAACSSEADPVGLRGITVSRDAIDFGQVALGASKNVGVQIENVGDAPVVLEDVRASVDLDPAFFFSAPSKQIAAKSSVSFDVTFEPRRDGDANGSIFIALTQDDRPPSEVTLVGSGFEAPLFIEETEIDLPLTLLGTTRRTPVTLRNVSTASIEVSLVPQRNVGVCPDATELFCIELAAPLPIPPGGEETIVVEFTPTVVDLPETGLFTLRACEGVGCDVEMTVRGEGVATGVDCTPPRLDFSAVNVGACVIENVECTNVVNAPATVDAVALEAGSSSAFTPDATTPVTIEGDSAWTLPIQYCPIGATTNRGTVNIEVTEEGAMSRTIPVIVEGRGGGPNIVVTPSTLEMGDLSLLAGGSTSFSISNEGDSDLSISEIVLDPEGSGAVSSDDLTPRVLAPGESTSVTLDVLPLSAGPLMFSVIVRSNDRDTPEAVVVVRAEGLSLGPCRYELSPSSFDLGAVARGLPLRRPVVVRNVGGDACLFRDFGLSADAGTSLRIVNAPSTVQLPAGESLEFALEYFSAVSEERRATLSFSVSDPTEPNPTHAVVVVAGDPLPVAYPDSLTFGPTTNACALGGEQVRVHNILAQPVRFSAPRLAGGDARVFVVGPSNLPAMVPSNGVEFFDVSFAPTSATKTTYVTTLVVDVEIAGVGRTLRIPLVGRVDSTVQRIDRFVPTRTDEVDILLVYEHVFNTRQVRNPLTDAFAGVFTSATAAGLDYRAAITTGDMTMEAGRFLAPFVDASSTPSAAELLRNATQSRRESGFNGVGSTLFEATTTALSAPSIDQASTGLLRRDAALAVVMVARNTERSTQSIEQTADRLMRLKGHHRRHLVTVTSVTGDLPSGCNAGTGTVFAGPRYADLAERTGGERVSYCTMDWNAAALSFAPGLLGRRSVYDLDATPVASTIEVRVDGAVVPQATSAGEQWAYDVTRNRIRFTVGGRPPIGAEVEVHYEQSCQ